MKHSLFLVAIIAFGDALAFTTSSSNPSPISSSKSNRAFVPRRSRSSKVRHGATKAPVFDEVCDTVGITLTRFMSEVAMLNPEISELTSLFGAIGTACKALSNLVKRSQLPSSQTLGYQGEVNVQGEDQKVRTYIHTNK